MVNILTRSESYSNRSGKQKRYIRYQSVNFHRGVYLDDLLDGFYFVITAIKVHRDHELLSVSSS